MAKPETLFRKQVVKFLRTLPFCKILSIQQKAITGHPDIILCLTGFFVGLEVKTDEGHPSARQVLVLEEVLKAKGAALIVRPNNMEEIKQILLQISRGKRYDQNHLQGVTPPPVINDPGKSGKHTNGPKTKLRSKQASGSNSGEAEGTPGREHEDPTKFRSI